MDFLTILAYQGCYLFVSHHIFLCFVLFLDITTCFTSLTVLRWESSVDSSVADHCNIALKAVEVRMIPSTFRKPSTANDGQYAVRSYHCRIILLSLYLLNMSSAVGTTLFVYLSMMTARLSTSGSRERGYGQVFQRVLIWPVCSCHALVD